MPCCFSSTSARRAACRPQPQVFACGPCSATTHHQRIATTRKEAVLVNASAGPGKLATVEDVQAALQRRGISLTVKDLGPLYRISCRRDSDGIILATTNGWINPLPRFMHCETLQVFTRGQGGKTGEDIPGGLLGLGVFVGVATFAYALSQGCNRAEILAINDSDEQHAKLLRYYKFFGFKVVKTVGDNGLADLPDQVVWGGVGTRMDADPEQMVRRWSPVVFRDSTDARTGR
eukprot:jgi/Ulvmu1/1316/UM011_0044.1